MISHFDKIIPSTLDSDVYSISHHTIYHTMYRQSIKEKWYKIIADNYMFIIHNRCRNSWFLSSSLPFSLL
jgi:hypothetical protein